MLHNEYSHYVEKVDRSKQTPGLRQLPGKDGVYQISETAFQQCVLMHAAEQSSVAFSNYDTTEYSMSQEKINKTALVKKKKSFFRPACLSLKPDYKNSPLAEKIANCKKQKISKHEELSILFALDFIKKRFFSNPINVFEVIMCRAGAYGISYLESVIGKWVVPLNLKIKVPILQLSSTLHNPQLHDIFDYDCLIYSNPDLSSRQKLTKKMLTCGYLCIKAKIAFPEDLKTDFKGWGLHIMTVKENGLDLSLVTDEITAWCSGEKTKRKLTALTREYLPNPWLIEEAQLTEIVRMFEDAHINYWLSSDGNFVNRVYTKYNGQQAALIVEAVDDGKYSMIAFMQPYDITTYKFIRAGTASCFK